ncbi:MAG: hypothetical protein M1352_01800 [Patescibacteria group bacterium]|nr:hypothetical protein [Patescibacteria group bacterium]
MAIPVQPFDRLMPSPSAADVPKRFLKVIGCLDPIAGAKEDEQNYTAFLFLPLFFLADPSRERTDAVAGSPSVDDFEIALESNGNDHDLTSFFYYLWKSVQ